MSVSSPCIDVCTINVDTGLCDGCYRTIAEITAWGQAVDQEKRDILVAIEARRLRLGASKHPPENASGMGAA